MNAELFRHAAAASIIARWRRSPVHRWR